MTLFTPLRRTFALIAPLLLATGVQVSAQDAEWMLQFDGAQNHYIQSQTTGLADGASQVSISARMQVHDLDDRQFLFGMTSGGGSTNEYQLQIWQENGEFRIGIADDAEEDRHFTGISAADYFNEWYEFSVKYDSGDAAFTIDGQEVWSHSTGGSALAALEYPLVVSTRNEGYDVGHRTLDGSVAWVVMEVAGSELVRWNLEEGEGSTAFDSSGNENHGDIAGASWISLAGPEISMTPAVAETYISAQEGITITATSSSAIPTEGVVLILNGEDRSSELTVTQNNGGISAQFEGLLPNRYYFAQVEVTDAAGISMQGEIEFNTLHPEENFTWEANDWNFEGGQFYDDPGIDFSDDPNYFDLLGVENVDELVINEADQHAYRLGSSVGTQPATDFPREPWASDDRMDAIQYNVGWVAVGEWLNYTRTFSPGEYFVYGRLARDGTTFFSAQLDRVTSDRTQPDQTTEKLGTFSANGTGGWQNYAFIPLRDDSGNLARVQLTGVETLRVTALAGGYNANFYMLVPADTQPPRVANLHPPAGTPDVDPATGIRFNIVSPAGVDAEEVRFILNGEDRSGELTFSGNENEWEVRFNNLEADRQYMAEIAVTDVEGIANTFPYTGTSLEQPTLFDFATFEGLIGLEFDHEQNHYIQSQATGLTDGASQVSISSRMFIMGVDDRQFLFGTSSGGGSTNEYQLKIWHQDGEFRIGITDDAFEDRPYTGIMAADYFFGWHDYKVTYNAGEVAFFIDGEELWNYSTGGNALAALDYPLMVSTRNDGYAVGHRTLDGRVADVVMEVGGEEVVRWNLDEGEGDIATDSSGNNNHGTIVGATWVVPEPREDPEEFPALSIIWDGNNHVISWDGSGFTLEAADEITGPWNALEGANPYIETEEAGKRFYRLRAE